MIVRSARALAQGARAAGPARWLAVLALVAVTLAANFALLDDFWELARARDLAVSGSDIATHYVRMKHARELYLPSGHRFGWDPFWFQGYVPFLLYPHLTYVVLAVVSLLVPVDPARLFNFYILGIYFALPLAAGIAVLRPLGFAAAIVVTAWFSVLSTTGAGLAGVFLIGLLAQQAGVVLFTLLAIDLVVTRRIERAAIWFGLIPLVHVHASLLAGLVWCCAGAVALLDGSATRRSTRRWLVSTGLAALIALPTFVGLLYGWNGVGEATIFADMHNLFDRLFDGTLVVPQPTLLALAGCTVATLILLRSGERARYFVFVIFGLGLFAVAAHRWVTDISSVDRVLGTMLYLRTLPFAFVWLAVVAISAWHRFPRWAQAAVLGLSLLSVALPRPNEAAISKNIGSNWRPAKQFQKLAADYRSALRWIARDIGKETATLALAVPRPRGTWLAAALDRCSLPLIGGHGVELTSINNRQIITRTADMGCDLIRSQVEDYAIGYFAGTDGGQLEKLESCLETTASHTQGQWWVIATGERWGRTSHAAGFDHDETWTSLRWDLLDGHRGGPMRLPLAMNDRWRAMVDGLEVEIRPTRDRMMEVALPKGARRLTLEYEGYPGDWLAVAGSLFGLTFAGVRSRRTSP